MPSGVTPSSRSLRRLGRSRGGGDGSAAADQQVHVLDASGVAGCMAQQVAGSGMGDRQLVVRLRDGARPGVQVAQGIGHRHLVDRQREHAGQAPGSARGDQAASGQAAIGEDAAIRRTVSSASTQVR